MNIKNIKTRVTKQCLTKCDKCRTYSDIALRYALFLESDDSVESFKCNVLLTGLKGFDKEYTSDFLITFRDGSLAVRECVQRDYISKPKNVKLLDASKEFWACRGVDNWGLVTNKE